MPVLTIDAIDDRRLDDYRDIRDREAAQRPHPGGLFIGEQALVVEKMLRVPGVTRSVLLSPNWRDRIAPVAPPEVPIYVAPLAVMKSIVGFNIHRGVLAVGYRGRVERGDLDAVLRRERVTLLLCEDVNNMDNIGLLFRDAAAFAVDGVWLSPRCHDPLYRKALRVSIGHALSVPYHRSTDWVGDLERLRRRWGITLIAAATGDRAVALDAVPRPDRVGIVVGDEYTGLPAATLDACDHVARVPMAAGVDSLNVGVAAAVLLHRFSTGVRA